MPAVRSLSVALFACCIVACPLEGWATDETDGSMPPATDGGVGPADPAPARDAGPEAPPAGVELPRLIDSTEAMYPAEAATAGLEAIVSLWLTIDEAGRVTAAEVLESAGHGFDEAARAAALRFRFLSARRDGVPIAARIRYEYQFKRPIHAVAPAPVPVPRPASPTIPPAAPVAPGAREVVTDVTVRGASAARRLRESAEAVTVLETREARRESADLGEVIARTQGMSIRRTGGLGSSASFSLNGLSGDQIRFFIDGVPLDVMGFAYGLANVPVNLVERIEIYRGVVPVRFGADALGGAVNLVSTEDWRGPRAAGSAEMGSFGTYRLTLAARHLHRPTGLYAAANVFLDRAANDYPVDVEVPDDRGRLSPARVHRFHDRYDAYGAGAEVGVVDKPWARRLVLRVFGTRRDKELQNNTVMSVPYGEARYWETARGAILRYEQPRIGGSAFAVNAVLAYGRRATDFKDLSSFVYDWFGRRIRERVRRGELGDPTDERIWQHTALARLQLSWTPVADHSLRLAVAPMFVDRTGRDRLITMGRDPLTAGRRYVALIDGLEYQADLFQHRLEAIAFGKSYLFEARSEEPLPGGVFRERNQDSHTLGYGASLRLRLVRPLWLKASYERATRLPNPDEIFGDGVLILANLGLAPERSHNGNLSLSLDLQDTPVGDVRGEVNAFVRHAENLIVLLGNDMVFSHQNVYTARSQGLETNVGWTSRGGHLLLDGNLTWQSLRNVSENGTFEDFKGDRIPNRPWLFANLAARVRKTGVSSPRDELSWSYYLRYVNGFFRGWESLGLRAFKQTVPDQMTHSAALTYLVRGTVSQTWSAEVQNLTDARTYDYFGAQRPGRAFYVKITAEY